VPVHATNNGVQAFLYLGLPDDVSDDCHLLSQLLNVLLRLSRLGLDSAQLFASLAEAKTQDLALALGPIGISSGCLSLLWPGRLPRIRLGEGR